ncbi:MAG: hypothetical protein HYU78_02355 [Rhodocyclales bacterium]|nr:hypothetical protein [Rhodocyclales bacterium]
MQQTTHTKTAISIVRDHVEDWRRQNRWSRETAADMIVQAHERIGGPRLTGIVFDPPTRDTFERMRVNADKIYRWLDDSSKDKNLLTVNFLWSIFAALPDERRLHLVDALLAPVGMHAGFDSDQGEDESQQAVVLLFQDVVAHGAEVNVAMSKMIDGIDPGEPEQAKKQLSIAKATMQRALGVVNRILRRKGKTCA